MQPRALKYILDIESVISEIESFKETVNNDFFAYQNNQLVKRAIERNLIIIGEATKKLLDLEPALKFSDQKKIIGLRNLLSHAYDSVEDELIWGIVQKDVPKLRKEVDQIRAQNN